jgi:hypothetical protein
MAIIKVQGTIKRGDAYIAVHTLTDSSGAPLVTDAANLTAQFRDADDVLLSTAVIEAAVTDGEYIITVADTTEWTPETYVFYDIEYSGDGLPASTDTYRLKVEKDITVVDS